MLRTLFWIATFLVLVSTLAYAELPPELKGRRVFFLGESHQSLVDHKGQRSFLKFLRENSDREVILVAEMFHQRAAATLYAHNRNESFRDFRPQLWKDHWGHDYGLYRPIWKLAHQEKLPLTWLRPDPELTKAVKKSGVERALPVIGEFFLGPIGYRRHLESVARRHLPDPNAELPRTMMDRFFLVQCFWDEFMAWRVAELVTNRPDSLLVVLVGHGHLHPEFGIPARLKRRVPEVTMTSIGFQEDGLWSPDLIFLAP